MQVRLHVRAQDLDTYTVNNTSKRRHHHQHPNSTRTRSPTIPSHTLAHMTTPPFLHPPTLLYLNFENVSENNVADSGTTNMLCPGLCNVILSKIVPIRFTVMMQLLVLSPTDHLCSAERAPSHSRSLALHTAPSQLQHGGPTLLNH